MYSSEQQEDEITKDDHRKHQQAPGNSCQAFLARRVMSTVCLGCSLFRAEKSKLSGVNLNVHKTNLEVQRDKVNAIEQT